MNFRECIGNQLSCFLISYVLYNFLSRYRTVSPETVKPLRSCCWSQVITTDASWEQDRWTSFLEASPSSLTPPGPAEHAKHNHGRSSGQRFGAETLKRYTNQQENNIELIAFQIRTAETLFPYSVSAPAWNLFMAFFGRLTAEFSILVELNRSGRLVVFLLPYGRR